MRLSCVAEKLSVAADAVLVAHHLPKLGVYLVTVLAHLHVNNPTRRSTL
jgi:hypothetical protein